MGLVKKTVFDSHKSWSTIKLLIGLQGYERAHLSGGVGWNFRRIQMACYCIKQRLHKRYRKRVTSGSQPPAPADPPGQTPFYTKSPRTQVYRISELMQFSSMNATLHPQACHIYSREISRPKILDFNQSLITNKRFRAAFRLATLFQTLMVWLDLQLKHMDK